MLTAFFGDCHGNLNTMYTMVSIWEKKNGLTLDLIVQVGDFGFWLAEDSVDAMTRKHGERNNKRRREVAEQERSICGDYREYILGERSVPTKTLVIRGNHEDQEYLLSREQQLESNFPEDYLTRTIEMVPNLFYLPDGHTTEIDGVKFGGLGGNFSIRTWENWNYWDNARFQRIRYGQKRRLNHFTRDRAEILRHQKMDVLLFHDAPSDMGLVGFSGVQMPEDEMTDKTYGQWGCPFLKELMLDISPRYTITGHWHQYRKKRFGNTTCIVLNKTGIPPSHDCMEVIEL